LFLNVGFVYLCFNIIFVDESGKQAFTGLFKVVTAAMSVDTTMSHSTHV